MSVYVDPLQASVLKVNWRYPQGCHLIADSDDELHAFATRLGLKLGWFQDKSTMPHYDLTPNKRKQAVRLGAVELTLHQMAERIRSHRTFKKGIAPVDD
ncbi:MAG: DUF4031 domain-containing protein [Planctomycetes bacterium]|nr:DUF4031 domain-containing protein [Planctomycetota bacterium]